MSRRFQRRSGTVTMPIPVSALGECRMFLGCVNMTTVGFVSLGGNAKSRSATPRVTSM